MRVGRQFSTQAPRLPLERLPVERPCHASSSAQRQKLSWSDSPTVLQKDEINNKYPLGEDLQQCKLRG